LEAWTKNIPQYNDSKGDSFAKKMAKQFLSSYLIKANGNEYEPTEVEIRFSTSSIRDIFIDIPRTKMTWTYYINSENEHSQFIEANLFWEKSKKLSVRINGICDKKGNYFVGTKAALSELGREFTLQKINQLPLFSNKEIQLNKRVGPPLQVSLLCVPRKASPRNDPEYNRNCWKNYRFYNLLHKKALVTLQDEGHKQVVALSFFGRNNTFKFEEVKELAGIKSNKTLVKWIDAYIDGFNHASMSSQKVTKMIKTPWKVQTVQDKCFLYGAWCGQYGNAK
jgi:hypothetical protein